MDSKLFLLVVLVVSRTYLEFHGPKIKIDIREKKQKKTYERVLRLCCVSDTFFRSRVLKKPRRVGAFFITNLIKFDAINSDNVPT